jgi:hypothetical protein
MNDLNRHDNEEYHFDDSESFDFGEHDEPTKEEFIGDEEVVEDTETKDWSNERPVAESSKKPQPNKKIFIGIGIVVVLVVGYYLMVPHRTTSAGTAIAPTIVPTETTAAKPAATSVTTTTPPADNNGTTAPQNATPTQQNATTASNTNTAADNADWLNTNNSTAPSSNNTSATTAAAPASDATTAQTTAQPNAPDETSLPIQIQTLNQENQTLTLKLQQVTAQSEETAARAKALEKAVAKLQAQINQTQVNQTTQISPPPLHRPQSAITAESVMPRSSAASNESKTPLVYYVQAIIPGRAWIADSNGRIITVTQGDRIEALNSTVKNIDPINGIVTLSNGMQIEYGMVAQ